MDTNVAGLNKVVCFVPDSTYEGKTVEITDNTNTWTQVIDHLSCVFMIPSMPAPAKKTFTVILYMADNITPLYTRTFELGFGDSIRIGLNERYEPVTKETVPLASAFRIGGAKIMDAGANGIFVDANGYLRLRDASSTQQGGVKVPLASSNGLYMNGNELRTLKASTSQVGSIMIGEGLQVNSSGVASIKPAGSTSSTKGGVYVESGGILSLYSDGKLKVPLPGDYLQYFEYYDGDRTINAGSQKSLKFRCTNSSVIYRFARLTGIYIEHYMTSLVLTINKVTVLTNYVEIDVRMANIGDTNYTWPSTNDLAIHYIWL